MIRPIGKIPRYYVIQSAQLKYGPLVTSREAHRLARELLKTTPTHQVAVARVVGVWRFVAERRAW